MAAPELTSQAALGAAGAPPTCQLARVQLRRYMAGDEIPEPLLEELRTHLSECEECKSESIRLRDALASVAPGPSPAPGSAPPSSQSGPLHKLLALFPTVPEGRLQAAIKAPKTVGLSIGLAVIVVLLSTVFRNPTAALGPKASESAGLATETKAVHEESDKEDVEAAETAGAESVSGSELDQDPHAAEAHPDDGTLDESGHAVTSGHSGTEGNGTEAALGPTVGGKVVVVGGPSHGTAAPKPEVAKPKPLSKPKTTQTRRTANTNRRARTRPVAKAAGKPATKPATKPQASTSNEPYVKVYN